MTYFYVAACICVLVLLESPPVKSRLSPKQFYGVLAIFYAVASVMFAVIGWTSNLYLSVAFGAYFAWLWWNNGGGDDTKRRLKRWAGRFRGVRRTAPAAAS